MPPATKWATTACATLGQAQVLGILAPAIGVALDHDLELLMFVQRRANLLEDGG